MWLLLLRRWILHPSVAIIDSLLRFNGGFGRLSFTLVFSVVKVSMF
jgi:hypothetical protein